ncbi:MAG: hypothetical protein QM763_24035 [Agriterribacter sp.]
MQAAALVNSEQAVVNLKKWTRSDRLSLRFDELNKTPGANYNTFKKAIEHENPEISANEGYFKVSICFIPDYSYFYTYD